MRATRPRTPGLRIVGAADGEPPDPQQPSAEPSVRNVDWAILMAHAQAGDSSSYRRLLSEISPYLRSLAAASHRDPLDIEDTVQDVLLSIHSVRHTYDPARPFGPWLVAIARRRIVDRLRGQGRRMSHESPMSPEHETFASPSANYGEGHDAQAVRDAVGRLPAGQRDAIRLIKLQEMSLREASSVTGLSIAALKVATHRGLKTLRKLMVKI
ncbi:MAG: sigma-70 family RNA polymerase sigma factor [Sphingomonadaceae bacterium]|nr:sigma-70 family RNA polymerase sigma factor [Sphingomonadaceae bacterium]